MRLINQKTGKSLVEFSHDGAIFYNKFLEQEMRVVGINIPHGLRGEFDGRDCVRLEDTDFQRAFREIYYLTSMNVDTFRWQD